MSSASQNSRLPCSQHWGSYHVFFNRQRASSVTVTCTRTFYNVSQDLLQCVCRHMACYPSACGALGQPPASSCSSASTLCAVTRLCTCNVPTRRHQAGVEQPSLRQPPPPRSPLRRAAASRAPAAQRRWALGPRRGSSMSGPGTWPPPAVAGPPQTRARSRHTSAAAAAPCLLRRT
jgi:hypothetical protein